MLLYLLLFLPNQYITPAITQQITVLMGVKEQCA
jgi:hypothetical protein